MTSVTLALLLAENSLFKKVGEIFQPVFKLFGYVLAFIYGIIPNYAIAIIILTILIMGALTPLTVKSTKSMIGMQQIQPEIKKLQAKYKGAENRAQLNEELMRLYKEQGVNPAGGCLPMFLQMPFLFILYDVIKGLTNTIPAGQKFVSGTQEMIGTVCRPISPATVCAEPRYIPTNSTMFHHLVASSGAMPAFGINLALKPFSHHGAWYNYVPYFALVAIAVVLQFIQMRQMQSRNPQAAAANPQMQTMQKVMPIFFAYIYFLIPAAVVIYMITSTLIRIATQDIMFRTGIVQPVGERSIPARSSEVKKAASTKEKPPLPKGNGTQDAAAAAAGDAVKKTSSRPTSRKPRPGASTSNGNTNGTTDGVADKPKPHPRSKAKRDRKAR
jgi:YidC/Oxa1 family membrane protein insertase